MRREDAKIAHLLDDDIAACVGDEKALPPLGRDALHQRLGIAPRAGGVQRGFVDLGGEDRHARRDAKLGHVFAQ